MGSFPETYNDPFQLVVVYERSQLLLGGRLREEVANERFSVIIYLGSYRPELYRCCLCWKDDITLLIGWADMVQVWRILFDITFWQFGQ